MNRTRRRLLVAACAVALQSPVAGQTSRRRVSWFARPGNIREFIRQAFASRGLVEGRDVIVDFIEPPPFDLKESESAVERLIGTRPDIVVVDAIAAYVAFHLLRKRRRDIPIVFYSLNVDPAKLGIVESLRRPGGNVTGTALFYEEMESRTWQMLKEVAPRMKNGGSLLSKEWTDQEALLVSAGVSEITATHAIFEDAERRAESQLGIRILPPLMIARDASRQEIEAALRKERIDAVVVHAEMPRGSPLADVLVSLRIPSMGDGFGKVRNGLLLGMQWDGTEGEAYAVEIVKRIVQGEKPATIPIQRQSKWTYAINRASARAMGIELPPSLLLQAARIFD